MLVYIDGWPMDLVVSQDAVYPGEVTEHAVDADADPSDHIRNGAMELTLACIVSDTPIGEIELHPTRAAEPVAPLHSEAAFEKLLEIRGRRRPVTIETPRRTYDSMGMTQLERHESVESAGGALFTVSFKHVRFMQNRRVTVRAAVVAKPKVKVGTKVPKPSKLVERRVDAHDGTWFDPDINAWREGASFNPQTNKWEYFKGTPIGYPKGKTDEEYRRLIAEQRDGALVPVDKKGVPGTNAGQFILLPGQF